MRHCTVNRVAMHKSDMRGGTHRAVADSRPRDIEIAVIGARRAGIAAATAARASGAQVLVIGQSGEPGAQFHGQSASDAHDEESAAARGGARDAARVRALDVEVWTDATVCAISPEGILEIDRPGGSTAVRAHRTILAAGVHDRVMPFPGWTMPGVTTPGAAQAMISANAVRAGQRFVVAGTGPFLLIVALALSRVGAVVEVIEAAPLAADDIRRFMRFPERWSDIASLVATLAMRGVPIGTRRVVTRVEGLDRLTHVVSARVDDNGNAILGSEKWHPADMLAIGYGFRTQSDVARLMGCALRYEDRVGGHAVIVDAETGRTSRDNVYAGGGITGVAGHIVASAEGTIAGLSAAASLGHPCDEIVLEAARLRRRDAQRFADLVSTSFAPPAGLDALATDDTIICRCEGVTRSAIDAAIDSGARTSDAVASRTGCCAMGSCQGRICGWALARIVAARTGRTLQDVDTLPASLPLTPFALNA